MIEDPSLQETREVFCPSNRKAKMVCISQNCPNNSFICLKQQCDVCEKNHSLCQCYRLTSLLKNISVKRKNITPKVEEALKQMEKVYDEAIERLSLDKESLQELRDMFGLHQHQTQFLKMIQDGCHAQITGKITSVLIPTLNIQNQFNADQQTINRFWRRWKKQFEIIFNKFKQLPAKKFSKLDSKITQDCQTISDFLGKQVAQFRLLYRASENNFSASKFHQKCDNKGDTLVIAKTEYGRIIGGYTPLKWSSQTNYVNDIQKRSFLFSISLKEKYDLTSPQHAIYCNPAYGPVFGGGHDMYIADSSATAQNTGYCNFGHSYNLNGKFRNGQVESFKHFSGSAVQYTKFSQWEVFQIQWM